VPVVSVKIDEETKKEMMKYKQRVDWPEVIREFILKSIEQIKREENLKEAEEMLKEIPSLPEGTSSRLVRKDREDSH
jgi:DNA polymerase elongation subunit (family B)